MIKLSVSLSEHKTSITIEEEFFDTLKKIAKNKNTTIYDLINFVDLNRDNTNLSSALRIYILKEIMKTSKL